MRDAEKKPPRRPLAGLWVFLLFWGLALPLVTLPLTRGYQPRLGLLGSLPDMVLPLAGAYFAYDEVAAFCLFWACLGGFNLTASVFQRRP